MAVGFWMLKVFHGHVSGRFWPFVLNK